jgi:ABC-type sugar transport system ATPase subunit
VIETAPITAAQTVLDVANVKKTFGGVQALADGSLQVRGGEVHALLGENGSGKSTMLNIVAGRLEADSGSVRCEGPIALVTQELRLAPDLSVAENVFLGDWPGRRRVAWGEMARRARAILERLGLELDVTRPVRTLSQDQRQLVEIGRALERQPRLLLLDEPTSALTIGQVERLFENLREERDKGTAVVFVSHKLSEIYEVADRVTVLRDGREAGTLDADPSLEDELIRRMVGRELESLYVKEEVPVGKPILELDGLSRGILDDVSLSVREGEIVGVAGLAGAGRSALARTLFGLRGGYTGTIRIDGRDVRVKRPADAIGAGMALVPEDRKNAGLMLDASVVDNFALTAVGRGRSLGIISSRQQAAQTREYVRELQIKTPGLRAPAKALSGGNQQKLVIAKWLRTKPRLLILDEPTRGVDIGAKVEIYRLIAELVKDGRGVLLISSDLPELLALSDRIVALYRGRVMGEVGRSEATEERVGRLIMGRSHTNGR